MLKEALAEKNASLDQLQADMLEANELVEKLQRRINDYNEEQMGRRSTAEKQLEAMDDGKTVTPASASAGEGEGARAGEAEGASEAPASLAAGETGSVLLTLSSSGDVPAESVSVEHRLSGADAQILASSLPPSATLHARSCRRIPSRSPAIQAALASTARARPNRRDAARPLVAISTAAAHSEVLARSSASPM